MNIYPYIVAVRRSLLQVDLVTVLRLR
jgi:hypothetical protein